jgi:Flp pilus assembly pilin Flp
MKKFFVELLKDESGLTTIEYVVGAAVVVVMAGAVFGSLQTALQTKLGEIIADI